LICFVYDKYRKVPFQTKDFWLFIMPLPSSFINPYAFLTSNFFLRVQGYGSFLLRDLPFDAIQFCIYEQLRIGYRVAVCFHQASVFCAILQLLCAILLRCFFVFNTWWNPYNLCALFLVQRLLPVTNSYHVT